MAGFFGEIFVIFACLVRFRAALQLPDTSGIDGQLTANHNVDHFFSFWLVFHNDEVQISEKPFTIFAPQNPLSVKEGNLLQHPDLVKRLLLDHVVLGTRLDLSNLTTNASLSTLGGRNINIWTANDGKIHVNNAAVIEKKIEVPNGILVTIDNYLFPYQIPIADSRKVPLEKEKAIAQATLNPLVPDSMKTGRNEPNSKFIENVLNVLSFLKSRVRVFQHFLSRSNVSQLLKSDEEYTVFVPTDHAFQRWHPIDWGFYPFSVPEFTESIIVNHFVKGRLKQNALKDGEVLQTLGGKDIMFRKSPNLTVNGAILIGDTPVENGNIMFIGEVLFINESVVSKLHQQNKDKETPPLLAFPWFGAQFLSHAFLALERDKRFKHISRFLNLADLAPHVSGTGYTFFVPVDSAFEDLGLDKMPDNYLSNGEGLQILLNHFVNGRLYDSDLKNNTELTTLGNQILVVKRSEGEVHINEAKIVESEVFVYNLGTMFYINRLLYANISTLPASVVDSLTTIIPEIDIPDAANSTQEVPYEDEAEIMTSTISDTTVVT